MGEYYGKSMEPEKTDILEELPAITLDDLEEESTRENIENIPAWKRMMRKK